MKSFIALIGLLTLATASPAADLFPPVGNHSSEIFVLGLPKQAEEIGRRMQTALDADPAWLKSYLEEKKPKAGEMLPYHKKFGVTKEEYAVLLQSIGKLTLNKIGDVSTLVEKTGTSVIISIEGVQLPVSTFEFSPDGRSMTCALGNATEHTKIDQTDASAPTGKWRGTQWMIERGNPDPASAAEFLNLKFSVGVDDAGRHLLYLRIVGRQNAQPVEFSTVIRWSNM